MPDYVLTDLERLALVTAAIDSLSRLPEGYPPGDLLGAMAKLTGTDTKVTVQRTYPPRTTSFVIDRETLDTFAAKGA